MASFAEKTLKQYNSSIRSWWAYCQENRFDIFSVNTSQIISFLTVKFNEGSSYSSLNTHRSALSIILGTKLTLDDNVSRFLKGVYRLRPPHPKYSLTWDTNQVLSYLSNFSSYSSISLEDLSRKTITLLAIASAQRMQTLSLIKLNNICIEEVNVIIKISELIKTSKPGAFQPLIRLPFIRENISICPATAVQQYIEKTASLRIANQSNNNLFIGIRKPHKNVGSQTLANWVKKVLEESGINISIFGAHSTRHASTSAARRHGVNLEVVRKAAGWSDSSNVFLKYYNREIINSENNDFTHAIFKNNID